MVLSAILRKKFHILCLFIVTLFCVYFIIPHFLHFDSVGHFIQNRYINQAFYRAPKLNSTDLYNASLLLYWTPFFQNVAYRGFRRKPFAECPVNNCVATNDRSYLRQARAILFHGADMSMYDVPEERLPHQLYVYYVHEAPPQLPSPLGGLNTAFNVTLTYRRDSTIFMPYDGVMRLNDTSNVTTTVRPSQQLAPPADGETVVAWVVSHCHTFGRREDYVDELRRYIPVDEFGACSGRPCAEKGALQCYQHLANTHIFYLAFENSLCRDYITEKFFYALRAGLIPIARGAARAEYEAVAPADSFIHVDDFAGPRELAAHLRWLAGNATALARHREWRRHYRFGSASAWCRVCELMSRRLEPGSTVVPDLHSWFFDDSWCHH